MAAKRAERLVNLVIALLGTRQYLTAARIRATVPGYEQDDGTARADEAFKRMFERDKAELREMWNAVRARYSELRCEVPILVTEGDKSAAFIRVFFRKTINQRMVQFDIAGFYTLRDGKIAHIREIIDTFDLVQQLLERDVAAILTGRRPEPI